MSRLRRALKSVLMVPIIRSTTGGSTPLPWPEEPLDLPTSDCGGYYAATLGEHLNSRYTVLRKLGWGQHSNVWLAQDTRSNYAAVKILTAHATSVQGRLSFELDILKRVRSAGSSSRHQGYSHVVELKDDFCLSSPHGDHLCLVTEVLGESLDSSKRTFEQHRFPVGVVKKITKQLLLALDFLHNDCQVIHTDIKPDNIHLTIPDLRAAVATEPPRERLSIENESQFPVAPVLSRPVTLPTADVLSPSNVHIKLTDFGVAATKDGFHAKIIQPVALRAPEVIIGCEWDASADIWNLGCLVFELLTGRWLFVPRGGPTWTPEDYHLAHMAPMVGERFDKNVFSCGEHYDKYFKDNGDLRIRVEGAADLTRALANYNVLSEEELLICADFIRCMLRLNPADRSTSRQLLQHEWLRS